MRATTNLLLSFALVLGPSVGCDVFDPDLLPTQEQDSGVQQDTGNGVGSECTNREPDRPAASDPAADDVPEFLLFAVRDVVLDQGGGVWTEIGYNLDCFNTTSSLAAVTDGHECVPPREHDRAPADGWTEERPPNVPLDGDQGIDNVFGDQFFPFVESSLETLSAPGGTRSELPFDEEGVTFQSIAREEQEAGRGTLLIGVSDWNGALNDTRMTVWIAQAAGGTPCEYVEHVHFNEEHLLVMNEDYEGDGELGPFDPAPPPAWEGNDCWWLRNDAFVPQSNPPELAQEDDLAYMTGGTAVIRLRDREAIQFFAGPVGARVIMTGAVSTAQLEGSLDDIPNLKLANSIVAGRWALNDLTQSGRHVGICPGSTEQSLLTTMLNRQADIRSNPNDPPSLDQACNAISMGVRFEEGIQGKLVADYLAGDSAGRVAASRAEGAPLPDFCD
jgi:hypothetical protein